MHVDCLLKHLISHLCPVRRKWNEILAFSRLGGIIISFFFLCIFIFVTILFYVLNSHLYSFFVSIFLMFFVFLRFFLSIHVFFKYVWIGDVRTVDN